MLGHHYRHSRFLTVGEEDVARAENVVLIVLRTAQRVSLLVALQAGQEVLLLRLPFLWHGPLDVDRGGSVVSTRILLQTTCRKRTGLQTLREVCG